MYVQGMARSDTQEKNTAVHIQLCCRRSRTLNNGMMMAPNIGHVYTVSAMPSIKNISLLAVNFHATNRFYDISLPLTHMPVQQSHFL